MKKIYCEVHNQEKRIHYVDEYMRVWPCCYFSQIYKPRFPEENIIIKDSYFDKKNKNDPEWNSLKKRPLKDILEEHLLKDYTFFEGWENNPSPVCVENCSTNDHLL